MLLRAIEKDLGDEASNIDAFRVGDEGPIIDNVDGSFREALDLLGRVGLNDAYLFLRSYRELSDGQRYRYKIACMIDEGRSFWIADEFCRGWLGYEPYGYMWPFLRDEGHFIANLQARQTGKTFNGMAKLLWIGFRYPGSLILVTAPKLIRRKTWRSRRWGRTWRG